jgi:hypothetical protein
MPSAFSAELGTASGRALAGDPLTRPAPAEENAGGGPPSPPRGGGPESAEAQKNLNTNVETPEGGHKGRPYNALFSHLRNDVGARETAQHSRRRVNLA